ncbi:hypothetical protein ALO46_102395 [Pseudomonas syringae pv. solidagae]|uniref:Uncharacterized protein n=1 Tax=Pseudomonas syringae pv. aceris TaxID=199198 RepID=A0A0L8IYH7_PSESX|nr:Unknown protein sequence [Pseudomonas syringae pv. aceris]KPW28456.1 hypothetical protein ALO91_102766 [Pseudomonas syringae pv. aceris]KPY54464.1 hypothetical protein ALO46_102395 [Pseudomonas syringae pv. solidagae]RMT30145.1 hypothetical protein ALP49_102412 [Pseudomonas syringae pv. solidagae]
MKTEPYTRQMRERFTEASTLTSSNNDAILTQATDSTSGLRDNAEKASSRGQRTF